MNPFIHYSDEELQLVDMSDVLDLADEQAMFEAAELVGPNSWEYNHLRETLTDKWFNIVNAWLQAELLRRWPALNNELPL